MVPSHADGDGLSSSLCPSLCDHLSGYSPLAADQDATAGGVPQYVLKSRAFPNRRSLEIFAHLPPKAHHGRVGASQGNVRASGLSVDEPQPLGSTVTWIKKCKPADVWSMRWLLAVNPTPALCKSEYWNSVCCRVWNRWPTRVAPSYAAPS